MGPRANAYLGADRNSAEVRRTGVADPGQGRGDAARDWGSTRCLEMPPKRGCRGAGTDLEFKGEAAGKAGGGAAARGQVPHE